MVLEIFEEQRSSKNVIMMIFSSNRKKGRRPRFRLCG